MLQIKENPISINLHDRAQRVITQMKIIYYNAPITIRIASFDLQLINHRNVFAMQFYYYMVTIRPTKLPSLATLNFANNTPFNLYILYGNLIYCICRLVIPRQISTIIVFRSISFKLAKG